MGLTQLSFNENHSFIRMPLKKSNTLVTLSISLLAEALFLVFADGRKETSDMGQKWL